MLRAIRGATTASANQEEAILTAVRELLSGMLEANDLGVDHLVCAFFSATPDIDAAFPAKAAREMGWTGVPLFGAQELVVAGAPERCVRVMLMAEVPAASESQPARHVYLRQARSLRPDLATGAGGEAAPCCAGSLFSSFGFYFYCL
jgi:chorismate mutase